MSSPVLVSGPTGKVGRRLIPLLTRRKVTVRTASRSPLPERAGIEPVRFDWTDESTHETARERDEIAAPGGDIRDALLATGASPETAEHNSRMYVHAVSSGALGVRSDDVFHVTRRPPVSFAEFDIGAAAAWRR